MFGRKKNGARTDADELKDTIKALDSLVAQHQTLNRRYESVLRDRDQICREIATIAELQCGAIDPVVEDVEGNLKTIRTFLTVKPDRTSAKIECSTCLVCGQEIVVTPRGTLVLHRKPAVHGVPGDWCSGL